MPISVEYPVTIEATRLWETDLCKAPRLVRNKAGNVRADDDEGDGNADEDEDEKEK